MQLIQMDYSETVGMSLPLLLKKNQSQGVFLWVILILQNICSTEYLWTVAPE